jgi:mono/diheme cytochrome c family protein
MNHHWKKPALILAFLGLALAAACGGDATSRGERLVMTKCVSCHSALIICKNLEGNDSYWADTVERMANMQIDLDREERVAVTSYLQELPPGTEPVCK